MSRKKQVKKRKLFSPDAHVTRWVSDLNCDLQPLRQEYVETGDLRAFLCSNLCAEVTKKYLSEDVDNEDLDSKTYVKFLRVNQHMAQFNDLEYHVEGRPSRHRAFMDNVLLRARALVHSVLGHLDWDEWFLLCKNSRGSTLGVPFVDTSLEAKSQLPITITEGAIHLLRYYFEFDPELRHAIFLENQEYHGPFFEPVKGSRATTVDKTNDIKRFICVEPTGNMFLQQGLMLMMYRRMSRFGLDVSSLPLEHVNRARTASLNGHEATIDWSSASDCVATGLLRWLIPPDWFSVLNSVRSHQMEIGGSWHKLNMFSTMGNAVTFPLETLTFWALGHAVKLTLEGSNRLFPEWEDIKSVSVFGDDCIVPSWMASSFMETLTAVGFLVNEEKSHWREGDVFRESCGGDFLLGQEVRAHHVRAPVSCRRSALEPWLYVNVNAFFKKYMSCFGTSTLPKDLALFRTFAKTFKENEIKVKLVPPDFPDDSGLYASKEMLQFISDYGVSISPIVVDIHGLAYFRYTQFRYWKERDINEDLRYAVQLKKLALRNAGLDDIFAYLHGPAKSWFTRYQRRKGGYVVARPSAPSAC